MLQLLLYDYKKFNDAILQNSKCIINVENYSISTHTPHSREPEF